MTKTARRAEPISPAHIELGHVIRVLRARRQLTQERLGDLCVQPGHRPIHRNYIGALERGEINPTFSTMQRLAVGLDVPASVILRAWERRWTALNTPPAGETQTTVDDMLEEACG